MIVSFLFFQFKFFCSFQYFVIVMQIKSDIVVSIINKSLSCYQLYVRIYGKQKLARIFIKDVSPVSKPNCRVFRGSL